MENIGKKGKLNVLLLSLDIIGFCLLIVGAGLLRFAKDEIIAVLGGFVLAGGVTVLSLTRLIHKW